MHAATSANTHFFHYNKECSNYRGSFGACRSRKNESHKKKRPGENLFFLPRHPYTDGMDLKLGVRVIARQHAYLSNQQRQLRQLSCLRRLCSSQLGKLRRALGGTEALQ